MSTEPLLAPVADFQDYDDEYVQRCILDTGFDELDMIRDHLALTPLQRLERLQDLASALVVLRNARVHAQP